MSLHTDQTGRTIEINKYPSKIISLVPSQTELLYSLGLQKEVIGITKFCVHPQHWFTTKTRIGGTKQIEVNRIKALAPNLIIANKEENVREQVEELTADLPVWISDVTDLYTACQMIQSIGSLTGKVVEAGNLVRDIQTAFKPLNQPGHIKKFRTAYLIWREPYMTVGGDTFIHQMMQYAGFENIFADQQRYPVVTITDLQSAHCELVLLSSEPYPFKQKHIAELKQYLPETNILLTDGEMFSWYGSRLLHAPAYFQHLNNQVSNRLHNL